MKEEFKLIETQEILITLIQNGQVDPHEVAKKYPKNIEIIEACCVKAPLSIKHADIDIINKLGNEKRIKIENVLEAFSKKRMPESEVKENELKNTTAFDTAISKKDWKTVAEICKKFWFEKPIEANIESVIQGLKLGKKISGADLYNLEQEYKKEDYVLTCGPLNKSEETFQLEKLVRKIIKDDSKFKVETIGENDYFVFDDQTKFNWTEIQANADMQHLSFNQDDFHSYTPKHSFLKQENEAYYRQALYTDPITKKALFTPESKDRQINFKEMQAINIYTGMHYSEMNKLLRGDRKMLSSFHNSHFSLGEVLVNCVLAINGLRKIPITTIEKSYRMIDYISDSMQREHIQAAAKQGVIELTGFVSTSIDKAELDESEFSERPLKYTFNNLRGAYVKAISEKHDESEFLIPPTQVRLSKYQYVDGKHEFEGSVVAELGYKKRQKFQPKSFIVYSACDGWKPNVFQSASTLDEQAVSKKESVAENILSDTKSLNTQNVVMCKTIDLLDRLEKVSQIPLTPEIENALKKIKGICDRQYCFQSFYGNAALNRLMLLDSEIAKHLTAPVLAFVFTNAPTDLTKIKRNTSFNAEINLKDAIYYGFKEGLHVIHKMPNNELGYGLEAYDTQKRKFVNNTMEIVKNISQAVGTEEIESEQGFNPNDLLTRYEIIINTIDLLKEDGKSDELLYVPTYSSDMMREQVEIGFKELCRAVEVKFKDLNTVTLDDLCEKFLQTPKAILDGKVSHLFYDRAHIEAALEQDTYCTIGEHVYKFRDIFRAMIQKIATNSGNYPLCATEQFCLRFGLVECDLQSRFKATYEQAVSKKKSVANDILLDTKLLNSAVDNQAPQEKINTNLSIPKDIQIRRPLENKQAATTVLQQVVNNGSLAKDMKNLQGIKYFQDIIAEQFLKLETHVMQTYEAEGWYYCAPRFKISHEHSDLYTQYRTRLQQPIEKMHIEEVRGKLKCYSNDPAACDYTCDDASLKLHISINDIKSVRQDVIIGLRKLLLQEEERFFNKKLEFTFKIINPKTCNGRYSNNDQICIYLDKYSSTSDMLELANKIDTYLKNQNIQKNKPTSQLGPKDSFGFNSFVSARFDNNKLLGRYDIFPFYDLELKTFFEKYKDDPRMQYLPLYAFEVVFDNIISHPHITIPKTNQPEAGQKKLKDLNKNGLNEKESKRAQFHFEKMIERFESYIKLTRKQINEEELRFEKKLTIDEELKNAVDKGNLEAVKKYCELNEVDRPSRLTIEEARDQAVHKGKWRVVEYLCDLTVKSQLGCWLISRILKAAVAAGELHTVEHLWMLLIKNQQESDIMEAVTEETLTAAAAQGKLDIVKWFCSLNTENKLSKEHVARALRIAASEGKLDIVISICVLSSENKPDTKAVVHALNLAVSNSYENTVAYLSEYKKKLDNDLLQIEQVQEVITEVNQQAHPMKDIEVQIKEKDLDAILFHESISNPDTDMGSELEKIYQNIRKNIKAQRKRYRDKEYHLAQGDTSEKKKFDVMDQLWQSFKESEKKNDKFEVMTNLFSSLEKNKTILGAHTGFCFFRQLKELCRKWIGLFRKTHTEIVFIDPVLKQLECMKKFKLTKTIVQELKQKTAAEEQQVIKKIC